MEQLSARGFADYLFGSETDTTALLTDNPELRDETRTVTEKMAEDSWEWYMLTEVYGLPGLNQQAVHMWQPSDPEALRAATTHLANDIFDWPDRPELPPLDTQLKVSDRVIAGLIYRIANYSSYQGIPAFEARTEDLARLRRAGFICWDAFDVISYKRDAWVYNRTRKPYRVPGSYMAKIAAFYSPSKAVPVLAAAAVLATVGGVLLVERRRRKHHLQPSPQPRSKNGR